MTKRLLVCDFDGTIHLKNNERHMSEVKRILERLADDVVFAVASGRPLHLLKSYIEDCYIISNDGALITYGNQVIDKNPINKDELTLVCQNREWVAYGECISYLHTNSRSQLTKWKQCYRNHAVSVKEITSITEDIYKIFFLDPVLEFEGLKKCYESYGVNEFTGKDTDKGKAVLTLAKHLGIESKDITVFGDGENDIPMFRVAGRSFAYQNASPNVRAEADRIYTDLKEELLEYEKL